MRIARPIVVVGVATLCLLLAGCLRPAGGPRSAPPDPGAAGNTDGPGSAGSAGSAGGSLEGRFGYATMGGYVEAVTPLVTEWLGATWPRMSTPRVVFVPDGAGGAEACVGADGRPARYSASSYEYCGPDQTIYVGQDLLWRFYLRAGDAGPAVGLAHEFGHHVQRRAGVPVPRSVGHSVRYENQADCLAGAWIRYTAARGWLEYPDDLADIDALFPLIGSAEGPGRDHGTAAERERSFARGLDGGPGACDAFFPATPVSAAG